MPKPDMQAKMLQITASIMKRLDTLEDLTAFLVRANERFSLGQRVRFSPSADRKGISARRKGGARYGRIVSISDGFTVHVLLDGYKRAHSFHHAFFEPVS